MSHDYTVNQGRLWNGSSPSTGHLTGWRVKRWGKNHWQVTVVSDNPFCTMYMIHNLAKGNVVPFLSTLLGDCATYLMKLTWAMQTSSMRTTRTGRNTCMCRMDRYYSHLIHYWFPYLLFLSKYVAKKSQQWSWCYKLMLLWCIDKEYIIYLCNRQKP